MHYGTKWEFYQRGMESFDETTVYENKMTDYNCVNCHSFCGHDPDKMLFHLRAKLARDCIGFDGDEVELLIRKQIRRYQLLPILIGILRVVTSLFPSIGRPSSCIPLSGRRFMTRHRMRISMMGGT